MVITPLTTGLGYDPEQELQVAIAWSIAVLPSLSRV